MLSPSSVVGTVVLRNLPITGQNWRDCVTKLYNIHQMNWFQMVLEELNGAGLGGFGN